MARLAVVLDVSVDVATEVEIPGEVFVDSAEEKEEEEVIIANLSRAG